MLGTSRIEAGVEETLRGLIHRHDVTPRTGIACSANRFIDHIPRLVPPWAFC
jgi:hypothetical protein